MILPKNIQKDGNKFGEIEISVSLTPEEYGRLVDLSHFRDRSFNTIIRQALLGYHQRFCGDEMPDTFTDMYNDPEKMLSISIDWHKYLDEKYRDNACEGAD